MKRPKVFILGLDGASPEFITRLHSGGRIPNISSMMEGGCFSTLQSTVPSLSAVAWTSFMTGLNPGRHGVFDIWHTSYQSDGSYRKMPLGAPHIRSRANVLWDILSHNDLFSVVVEPMAVSPAYPFNGVMEAGHSTLLAGPGQHAIWPPEMSDLHKRSRGFSDFPDNLERHPFQPGKFKRDADKILYLISNTEFDFFFAWLNWIDGIQHHWWRHEDRSHLTHSLALARSPGDESVGSVISDYYSLADRFIGAIKQALPEDTVFMVMSDHGFSAVQRYFYLNRFLYDMGLLNLKTGRGPRRTFGLRPTELRYIPGIGRILPRRRKALRLSIGLDDEAYLPALDLRYQPFETVDWENTRAFGCVCGVNLNVKGREPAGIVGQGDEFAQLRRELAEMLSSLQDPRTGEPVCRVRLPEEVYSGPYTKHAPDLVVTDWEKSRVHVRPEFDCLPYRYQYELAHWLSGSHLADQPGILIASGPGINSSHSMSGAEIVDLFPTVLYLMDIPIPSDADGKVLADMLDSRTVEELGEPRKKDYPILAGDVDDVDMEVDRETIRRMRGLGYLA